MGTAAHRRREFLYLLLIGTQKPEADALHLYQPLGVRFIVWKRRRRASADAVPPLVEIGRVVLLWLKPVTDLAILLAFVGEVANLCGCEHEALRCVECDVAADDEEVSQKSFELAAEWNWVALGKRLHLEGVGSGGVLTVNKDVNAFGVSCGGHDVPAEARQAIADVEEADVADDLVLALAAWFHTARRSPNVRMSRRPRLRALGKTSGSVGSIRLVVSQ